jgi:hypothetical protein
VLKGLFELLRTCIQFEPLYGLYFSRHYVTVTGGSIDGGALILRARSDWPCGPLSRMYVGYRLFPGGKAAGACR